MAHSESIENETKAASDRTIVLERVFDAPRELVWRVWTDPKHIDQWWGPNGFRNVTASMDVRVGGEWRYVMNGPDGTAWKNWVRYEEVRPNERLVYAHGGDDEDVAHFHVTIVFSDVGRRTKVSMRSVFPTAEACAAVKQFGAVESGKQNLARLAGFLPHYANGDVDRSMVLTRLFDAPAKVVFDAWTTREALASWWGPKTFTTPIVEIDFRVGGAYRMVMRDPAGNDYPFHGHYREIVPNARIVFDAHLDHEGDDLLTTVTFDEEDGKTRLTVVQERPRGTPGEGQMEGWSGTLEKLAAVLTA